MGLSLLNPVPGSTISSVQNPFAEIDYKTSGGRDEYNAMQLALTRHSAAGVSLNAQYTLATSKGTSGGSNEARTAGNNARLASERPATPPISRTSVRQRIQPVRRPPHLQSSALYSVPGNGMLTGGWSLGGIASARSGLPIEVLDRAQ